ncbi:FHA domain-containing protein, partial [Parabacteroides sp. OttesenSCG-928-O15]|nr:FHA domain-containing protein [Parabacteroides sp. OttesenSCG-928-O15]
MINIGKENDNHYIVDDPHVSRHHARLEKQEDGVWLLVDLDSTNGTYVNDQQVARKRVNSKDEIRFGGQYVCSLTDILNQHNDYSEEFAQLKKVYDRYIESKVKIQSSNQFKIRLLQSLPFALLGVVGVALSFLDKGSPLLMTISLFIMICAPTIGIFLGA